MLSRNNSEFHDETLHPTQHFTANRVALPGDGERRLMGAILEDAVASYKSACKSDSDQARDLVEELDEWFADEDETYLFSFPSICSFLDIRVDTVREHLKRAHWSALKERARRRTDSDVESPVELAVDEDGLELPLSAVAGR